jgi:hypothetical protein
MSNPNRNKPFDFYRLTKRYLATSTEYPETSTAQRAQDASEKASQALFAAIASGTVTDELVAELCKHAVNLASAECATRCTFSCRCQRYRRCQYEAVLLKTVAPNTRRRGIEVQVYRALGDVASDSKERLPDRNPRFAVLEATSANRFSPTTVRGYSGPTVASRDSECERANSNGIPRHPWGVENDAQPVQSRQEVRGD